MGRKGEEEEREEEEEEEEEGRKRRAKGESRYRKDSDFACVFSVIRSGMVSVLVLGSGGLDWAGLAGGLEGRGRDSDDAFSITSTHLYIAHQSDGGDLGLENTMRYPLPRTG